MTEPRSSGPVSSSSASSHSSLVKLDELSSFGATKQARLPTLIKLNQPLVDLNSRDQQQPQTFNSMPDFGASQGDSAVALEQQGQQQSLPVVNLQEQAAVDKENEEQTSAQQGQDASMDGFQVVDMDHLEQMNSVEDQPMVGPSLPPQVGKSPSGPADEQAVKTTQALGSAQSAGAKQEQYASHLGDSLIEMVINLRNENQNLIHALETNNEFVKERLSEFKRCQEESKKREAQFQLEKAELEHNLRKVQRQNAVLSERLKSMEAKLKDMKIEVTESLSAAHSSKASSIRGEENIYPQLADTDSFGNAALTRTNQPDEATTMQVDATSGELYNDGDQQLHQSQNQNQSQSQSQSQKAAADVATMSKEELSKRFDAKKAEFYAMDDPMRQCDQLEQQLNDIGKRDYEICLLQQQLNIYRQDFRLERMAKLEAKIQIEKLKNEIDRLCLERIERPDDDDDQEDERQRVGPTPATAAADGLIGKLGHQLSRKAIKSAAKAARYASKQAHLEEKAAAALARAAAARGAATGHFKPTSFDSQPAPAAGGQPDAATYIHVGEHPPPPPHHHSSRRHHHHRHHRGVSRGLRGEIVNELMSTANKALSVSYNLASTAFNTGLEKLSQYEQQQALGQHVEAGLLDKRQRAQGITKPSAPPMDQGHPSVD